MTENQYPVPDEPGDGTPGDQGPASTEVGEVEGEAEPEAAPEPEGGSPSASPVHHEGVQGEGAEANPVGHQGLSPESVAEDGGSA